MPALAMGLTDHSETRKRSFWGVRWAQDRQRSRGVPSSSAGGPRGLLLRHESCPQTPPLQTALLCPRSCSCQPPALPRRHRPPLGCLTRLTLPSDSHDSVTRLWVPVFPALLPHLPGCSADARENGPGQEEPPHEQPPGPALPHLTEATGRGRLSPVTPPTAPGPLPWPAPRHGGSGRHCLSPDRWRGLWLNFYLLPQFLAPLGKCGKSLLLPLIWNGGRTGEASDSAGSETHIQYSPVKGTLFVSRR